VGGHEGYITVGQYEDGQPGEIFVTLGKAGSTLAGFADAFATAISLLRTRRHSESVPNP